MERQRNTAVAIAVAVTVLVSMALIPLRATTPTGTQFLSADKPEADEKYQALDSETKTDSHRNLRVAPFFNDPKSVVSKDFETWSKTKYQGYIPSSSENFILTNSEQLGYGSENDPSGCAIWEDPQATNAEIHSSLLSYDVDLERYTQAVKQFQPLGINIHEYIQMTGTHDVCDALKLHSDGLSGLFPSGQLSMTKSGFVEPLMPPLRDHKFCLSDDRSCKSCAEHIMSIDYLVHDFEFMCHNLKPTSKKVFIDMGASLQFHGDKATPVIELLNLYEKFGFHFDHIYAFEVKFTKPGQVFNDLLPAKYFAAYHWINTGVNAQEGHKMNPLESILQQFSEDDLIVVKLDIDKASVEMPLVQQLLAGGPGEIYHRLVDQFYFEHHVHFEEMARYWRKSMKGTIKQSLEIFYGLRERGIPAHYWP